MNDTTYAGRHRTASAVDLHDMTAPRAILRNVSARVLFDGALYVTGCDTIAGNFLAVEFDAEGQSALAAALPVGSWADRQVAS